MMQKRTLTFSNICSKRASSSSLSWKYTPPMVHASLITRMHACIDAQEVYSPAYTTACILGDVLAPRPKDSCGMPVAAQTGTVNDTASTSLLGCKPEGISVHFVSSHHVLIVRATPLRSKPLELTLPYSHDGDCCGATTKDRQLALGSAGRCHGFA